MKSFSTGYQNNLQVRGQFKDRPSDCPVAAGQLPFKTFFSLFEKVARAVRQFEFLVVLCLLPLDAFANLNENLNSYLSNLNTYSHVDSNGIYYSQRAGYMTGGGISIRNAATDTKFANVQLPKFDAGCGGIDIFSGGISFISHVELEAALKNIMSAAKGYAFMLGIEAVSPMAASTVKQMQSWANTINSLGINSCETATGLVGAVWPRRTAAKQQICRSAKSGKTGFATNYINARHQCSDAGDYASTMENMAKDPLHDDLLLDEYNLAWKAIQKQPFLAKKENKKFAEEIMSLTGTIIVRQNEQTVIEPWPSRVYDESFFQILLEGGKTKIYQCTGKSQDCLSIETKELTISPEESWKGRIKQALSSIQQKILTDTQLSKEEIDLLSKSRVPLFKIVNIMTAYKRETSPISLYEVADIVGAEMLTQYLREIIGIMRMALIQLERGQQYDFDIKNFIDELDRVEGVVSRHEERNYKRLQAENQLMNKIELLEQKIASQVILF
jgi:conjugative transfer pilus assembly protein TraH